MSAHAAYTLERYRSSDGLSLAYRDYAAPQARGGLPLLCLHGLTRNSADFDALARERLDRHRVIAPDLRGRGDSARDPQWHNYHVQTYLQDLLELIRRLQLPRFVVVGTSLGGLMAMLLAQRIPRQIAGVVLNDIGPELAPAGIARIGEYTGRQARINSWQDAADACRHAFGAALPDFGDVDWLRFARLSYREDASGVPHSLADPMIGAALRAGVGGALGGWALYEALQTIPTLLLRGELSDLLMVETVQRMQQRKPDLTVVTVPGRGHVPQLDEPASRGALDAFLRSLGRT